MFVAKTGVYPSIGVDLRGRFFGVLNGVRGFRTLAFSRKSWTGLRFCGGYFLWGQALV